MSFFFGDVKTDELKIENGIELYGGYNNAYKVTLNVQNTMATEYTLKLPLYLGSAGQALVLDDATGTLIFSTVSGGSTSLSSINPGSAESNLTTTAGNIRIAPDVGNILFNVPTAKYYSFDVNNSEYLYLDSSSLISNASLIVNNSATISGVTNLDNTTQTTTIGTGAVIIDGGVSIAKNSNIGGNLHVEDNTVLKGTLNVTGTSTLATTNISGASNINSTLDVTGATDIFNTLNVTGTSTLATTNISGASNINSTLDVTGATNIYDSLDISGDITTSNTFTLTQGTISISSNQTLTLDLSTRSDFILTFTGNYNLTLSLTNANKQGQQGTIIIKTPSSGTGHTLSWSTSVGWYFPSATAPTLSSGNDVYDTFSYLVVDSSSPHVLVMDATNFQSY